MGWIIFTVFVAFILLGVGQLPRLVSIAPAGEEGNYRATGRWVGRILSGFLLILWFIITLTATVHSIDRGHDGLVETFGQITGHRSNGLAFTAPWQKVEVVNVQQQTICADGQAPDHGACSASYEPFSKESIDVHVKAVVTYQIDSDVIQSLYTNIGPNYVNKIILPNMNQILKEEVVRFNAVDIVPNRQEITDKIVSRIQPILAKSSINLVQVNLTNIDFDDSVKKAIEGKVIAAQQAQAAQAQVAVAEATAAQAIAKSKGDAEVARQAALGRADAAVTDAQGQAKANDLINASLTPQLIQLRTIEKLANSISVVGIPTSGGNLFDLGGILTPRPAAPR
jgi:regulator of protease activity HflC (stomatin/prohibitin superfamily)